MYLLHHLVVGRSGKVDRCAIIDGDAVYSYGQFASAIATFATKLRSTGVARGDRVAVFLPKSFAECVAIFAPSVVGGVVIPVNAALKPQQVAHIVSDSGARAIITTRDLAETLQDAFQDAGCAPNFVFADGDDAQSDADPLNLFPDIGIGEDLAAILYTSGSTGQPKGVMLSHRNMLAGTRIVRTYLSITSEDRLLSLLPFSFDYGLNQLLTTVEQGATLVLAGFRLGDDIVKMLNTHNITGLAGVPTIWAILAKAAPSLTKTALPHLRYITNSGGAVPTPTVKRLRELLPNTQIFLMYGLTEAFRSTFLSPDEVDARPTSIGKAIPETEVFVVTKEGTRAGVDEPGILVHRGPTVSLGYWMRPEETERVLRPNPLIEDAKGADTVCFSGDLVTQDKDGYLYFVARDDAMIKSAGFRISPSEVEDVVMAQGGFSQLAVIGVPDEWVGQKVIAIGVTSEENLDTKAVLKKVADTLPGHMVPAKIELVDALPVTANGKVDYKQLVAERAPQS